MNGHSASLFPLLKRPSALLPVLMSALALALVIASVALHGVVHDADEGAVAHLWQFLMAGQLPILAVFAFTWLPRAPRAARQVIALQLGAALAAIAPVSLLGL